MPWYTVRKINDSANPIAIDVFAESNRHLYEKLKPDCGVRPKTKLKPKHFFAAGFLDVCLGGIRVFPARKKRNYTPKHRHHPHPRQMPQMVMLAA